MEKEQSEDIVQFHKDTLKIITIQKLLWQNDDKMEKMTRWRHGNKE